MEKEKNRAERPPRNSLENCPHCGIKLSRWEQVLLSVDRALMCKNCWYRIILAVFDEDSDEIKSEES